MRGEAGSGEAADEQTEAQPGGSTPIGGDHARGDVLKQHADHAVGQRGQVARPVGWQLLPIQQRQQEREREGDGDENDRKVAQAREGGLQGSGHDPQFALESKRAHKPKREQPDGGGLQPVVDLQHADGRGHGGYHFAQRLQRPHRRQCPAQHVELRPQRERAERRRRRRGAGQEQRPRCGGHHVVVDGERGSRVQSREHNVDQTPPGLGEE